MNDEFPALPKGMHSRMRNGKPQFRASCKADGKQSYLYEGPDLFEAACVRKSFEAAWQGYGRKGLSR